MNKTPKLRFKGFSGDWESKKLEEVTSYVDYRGKTPPKSEHGIFLVTAKNIKQGYIDYSASQEFISEESYEEAMRRGLPKKGDVLLTTEAPLGNVAQIDREDIALAQRVIKFRGIDELDNTYLKYYFLSEKFQNKLFTKAIGTTVLGIQGKVLHKMPVSLPTIDEQEKIATFTSLIDNKAFLQGQKVKTLKDYKTGMMQKIFSRELRFKDDDGRDYPEWEEGKVKDIITEHLYQVDKPLNAYWRLGLRSHGKGTFHEYVTDPSKISMDKLYEVKKDMLIVNITFAWEHAIAITDVNDEGKLVSHRFPTYDFNENAIYNFYKYYILLPKFKYCLVNASPGGAGRNRVLNKKQFLEIYIPIPCIEEQKKISKVLNQLDIKINKEQEKLDSLNEYKKGLLQQMFV